MIGLGLSTLYGLVRTFVAFHTTSLLQNKAQNSDDTRDIKQGAHEKEHIQ